MADLGRFVCFAMLAILFISSVEGQKQCYQCFGLGSQFPLLAQTAAQFPLSSCADIGTQTKKIECNGRCFTQNFTVNYVFQQAGIADMEVDYLILGCGDISRPLGCGDFNALPNIDEVRQQTENVVMQYGGKVSNFRGTACFCRDSLCNAATTGVKTSAALLLACLALLKAFF